MKSLKLNLIVMAISAITLFICNSALSQSQNIPLKDSAQPEQTAAAAVNTFKDEQLGYSIKYPSDWIVDKPSSNAVTFSGKEGTPAYYATVTIQNLASKAGRGKYFNVENVINDFKTQLRSGAADLAIFDDKPFTYRKANEQLRGRQFNAEYTLQGQRIKQTLIVIPHPNLELFYAWSYTCPSNQYDVHLATAQAMLESWTIEISE